MKSWYKVIQDCLEMYRNRERYAYFYGAKGQTLTDSVMTALWNAEPGHFKGYTAEEKKQIFNNSRGKIGYDCSGFVNVVSGEPGYSSLIYSKRTKETTLQDGFAGQFLYSTWGGNGRHIGMYLGFGYAIDMGTESTDKVIKEKRDSIRITRVKDVAWEHSFQTAAVDYKGSISTDPAPQPEEKKQYVMNGKDYSNEFDPAFYADTYADLKKAFGYDTRGLLQHWISYGIREGRKATDGNRRTINQYVYQKKDYTSVFDPKYYAETYPDLMKAFGYDTYKLLQHYVVHGIKEGRKAKP